jgi:flagellar secretion chaperone FliS
MYSAARHAVNAYSTVSTDIGVMTANPHKLVLMLFEGARLAVATAKLHMQREETAAKGEAISKAIAIIDQGLKASLDLNAGGDLAEKLHALYDYMISRLLIANLRNERKALDEVGGLLTELHGAWEAIGNPVVAGAVAESEQRQPGAILDSVKA